MEQKKILWIVAALGIFLLVIFLGTLIIYSPKQTTPTHVITSTNNNNNDTWVNTAELNSTIVEKPVPATQQTDLMQTGDVTVISQGQTTVYSQDGVTTIDLTAVANAVEAEKTTVEPAVRPVATRLPSSSATTQNETAPKQQSVSTPKPAATKPVVSKAPESPKPVAQYWVQAASFVSKSNADNARSALVSQKIPAEVFTHANSDGVTFYRVRVGPYTTKSEAEYWNTLIKTVDNFADAKSYVTNTAKPAQ